MSIDREQLNVEGNLRLDIPDFRTIMEDAFKDMRLLIQLLTDDGGRRVVKPYTQGTHVGLVFKIATDVERGFYDVNGEWVVKSPDAMGSTANLTLSPSTTNYVEVRVNRFTDNPQPRAFWDVDIGLTGEEYFDTINVRQRIEEGFQSNTTGFTAGAVPLFTVVTGPSAITTVVPAQDQLFKPRVFSLPSATTRETVYAGVKDLRSFIDFLTAILNEAKGTGATLASAPWSSLKLLREYQGLFITSAPVVTFEGVFGTNNVNWSADLLFDVAGRAGGQYSLPAMTIAIPDGSALYVAIPEAAPPGALTPMVVPIGSVPINPTAAGSSPTIMTLFIRRGSTVYGAMDLAPLDSGESDTVGRDLPVALRLRLGLLTETTFQAYTSTGIIASSDTYPEAISKLDNELVAIQNNVPLEGYWIGDGVTTTFNLGTATLSAGSFTWSTDNTKADIVVTDDGRIQTQDYTGGTGQNFRKLTTTSIQFNVAPTSGSRIKVRKEGSSYGGAAPPSSGNLWSDPVDANIIPPDLAFNLGSSSARFAQGFIDQLFVGNLILRETVGDCSPFKSKVNGEVFTITAGMIVALYTDGKIYQADANDPQRNVLVGIAVANIAPGVAGRCFLFGTNIPGVLASSGFAPREEVFVSNTGAYTTGSGLDGTSAIAKVGWADCADGAGSSTVTDLILIYQKISQP